MLCPDCNNEWPEGTATCPVCSKEFSKDGKEETWMKIGAIKDGVSADFAREVLASYDIPAVVISKSGFFGQVGLTFPTFYKAGSAMFEVSVPTDFVEEASGVLEMALGDNWMKED
jgi:RNA polymerase subunit RPABC4/transcription elongation factor Spt4